MVTTISRNNDGFGGKNANTGPLDAWDDEPAPRSRSFSVKLSRRHAIQCDDIPIESFGHSLLATLNHACLKVSTPKDMHEPFSFIEDTLLTHKIVISKQAEPTPRRKEDLANIARDAEPVCDDVPFNNSMAFTRTCDAEPVWDDVSFNNRTSFTRTCDAEPTCDVVSFNNSTASRWTRDAEPVCV